MMKKLVLLFVPFSLSAWSQELHYSEIYTINTVAHIEKIQALASEINICAFSPDEHELATFDLLLNFNIWDIAGNRIKKYLGDTLNPFIVYDIEYSKSHNLLLAGGEGLRIYDSRSYQLRKCISVSAIHSIAAGSRFFFTCSDDGVIRMWDNEKLAPVDSVENGNAAGSLRLNHAENKLYAGGSNGYVYVYAVDNAARKINISDSIKAYSESLGIGKHAITDIDITADDGFLLVNPDVNAVYRISIGQKAIVSHLVATEKGAVLVMKAVGRDLYATALETNKLVLRRFSDNRITGSIPFYDFNVKDYMGPVGVHISPGCRYIAFANGYGIIHILERK